MGFLGCAEAVSHGSRVVSAQGGSASFPSLSMGRTQDPASCRHCRGTVPTTGIWLTKCPSLRTPAIEDWLQLVWERPVVSPVLLLRPSLDGAADSAALPSAALGLLSLLTRPQLPVELPKSPYGALPEGPPVLLLGFLSQPEASLISWLAAALPSHLELAPGPLVSPGCLL